MSERIWDELQALFKACCPDFGQPADYAKLFLLPPLIVVIVLAAFMPMVQEAIVLSLWDVAIQWNQSIEAPVLHRMVYRMPTLTAELVALVPWLWLASVLMTNWLQSRRADPSLARPVVSLWQGRVWRNLAVMIGVCILLAIPTDVLLNEAHHADEVDENFSFHIATGTVGLTLFLSLIPLSRYGLAIQGIATGRRISFRDSRRRLNGRSARLFMTFVIAASVAHIFSLSTDDAGWGMGPMRVTRADNPVPMDAGRLSIDVMIYGARTSEPPIVLFDGSGAPAKRVLFTLNRILVLELIMFALTICVIAEFIARASSATRVENLEPQTQPASAST